MNAKAAFSMLLFCSVLPAFTVRAQAQAAPSPSPSPTANPYPCTSLLAIVTRPTVATSVCTVPARKALLETGYTNTITTGSSSGITVNYPQALLRLGSGDDRFEYEFLPPSVNVTNFGAVIQRGATDMGFGLKYVAAYSTKFSWGTNVLATVPSGSSGTTSGLAQYTGNLNWGYQLNPTIAISGTVGLNDFAGFDASGNNRHFFSFIPSEVITIAYPQNSQFFAEYANFSQVGPGLGARSLFDYGFVHDFGSHVQVDIEAGVQPTTINGQRLHYFGAGISLMN